MKGFVLVLCICLALSVVQAGKKKKNKDKKKECLDAKCGKVLANLQPNVQESQASVFSQTKEHALYLTIFVKTTADAGACAKTAAKLQTYVDTVSPPDVTPENKKILAGVGFGQNFYTKLGRSAKLAYAYPPRTGSLGPLPATGGDIFIHAKSDSVGKLFELAQALLAALPDCAESFEDIYSFVYKDGRDLSGFIDGTENPSTEAWRKQIAVEKSTGGSYVITQTWVHDLELIAKTEVATLEGWVGRKQDDSTELANKSKTSHVARMVGGPEFDKAKPFQIVRQSMPYGSLHSKAGLFFIAYAESPQNFEFMLKGMTGEQGDKLDDDVMRLSEAVSGQYWYFPSVQELSQL